VVLLVLPGLRPAGFFASFRQCGGRSPGAAGVSARAAPGSS